MLFRTIAKSALRELVDIMLETNEIIGPKRVSETPDGNHYHYLPVDSFDEIDLDYDTTDFSAKSYLMPYKVNLSTFKFQDNDWEQEISYRVQPRVLFGLHACDIHGLLKLDKVFVKDLFPSPYYVSRRKNTVIIGIDHMPCEKGFCRSLGTDTVTRGFDLFLTDLGERYFVAIDSDRGFNLLNQVKVKDITNRDTSEYLKIRKQIVAAYKTKVNVQNLPNLLDIEFESKVWEKWGDKCLSCGSCAMVCPTCYCYGINEYVSMDFSEGVKQKMLYSCNLKDFALVAGGHNFRPERKTRLKYRYYHQHRGFVENYDEPKCVGCNRCGRACLAGINPPDVIADLQAEEKI
ncbi:4Fe-4S dicluster domain-containing protein [candidate division KSB1 bacterium]